MAAEEDEDKYYRIWLYTGSVVGAEAEGNIQLTLCGENGEQICTLEKTADAFTPGALDTYLVALEDVGVLQKLRVNYDPEGRLADSQWFLLQVIIRSTKTGQVYQFPFNTWLSGVQEIAVNEIWLEDSAGEISPVGGRSSQGNVPSPDFYKVPEGADQYILPKVTLVRPDGVYDPQQRQLDAAEEAKEESLIYEKRCTLIQQQLDPILDLAFEDLLVDRERTWDTRIQQAVSGDPASEAISQVTRVQEVYNVLIYTGAKEGAGSDANVYLNMRGSLGSTGQRLVRQTEGSFEARSQTTFQLSCVPIGAVQQLSIGHDNAGHSPAWYVDKVVVQNEATGHLTYFPCKRWLARDKGDGKLECTLEATEDWQEVEQKAAAVCIQSGLRGRAARRESQLKKQQQQEYVGVRQYCIQLTTRDIRCGGKDASVFINLVGELGDSGECALTSQFEDLFEAGSTDEFIVELPYVGNMTQVIVAHESSDMESGWFLNTVAIIDMSNNYAWEFPCNQWLKHDVLQRERAELQLLPTPGPPYPPEADSVAFSPVPMLVHQDLSAIKIQAAHRGKVARRQVDAARRGQDSAASAATSTDSAKLQAEVDRLTQETTAMEQNQASLTERVKQLEADRLQDAQAMEKAEVMARRLFDEKIALEEQLTSIKKEYETLQVQAKKDREEANSAKQKSSKSAICTLL